MHSASEARRLASSGSISETTDNKLGHGMRDSLQSLSLGKSEPSSRQIITEGSLFEGCHIQYDSQFIYTKPETVMAPVASNGGNHPLRPFIIPIAMQFPFHHPNCSKCSSMLGPSALMQAAVVLRTDFIRELGPQAATNTRLSFGVLWIASRI